MQLLNQFLRQYEEATNAHDFSLCAPYIHEEAVYWFTDGSFTGLAEIRGIFEKTWATIQSEVYSIRNVTWLYEGDDAGCCIYDFHWQGVVDGEKKSGEGRGTNIIKNVDGNWKIIHEHLSRKV